MLPFKIFCAHNAYTFDPSHSTSGHFSHIPVRRYREKDSCCHTVDSSEKTRWQPKCPLTVSNQADGSVYDTENSAVTEEYVKPMQTDRKDIPDVL